MKPLDPRLFRVARGLLPLLGGGAALGAVKGVAILVWSWSIANLVTIAVAPLLNFEVPRTAIGRAFERLPAESAFASYALLAVAALFARSAATWLIGVVSERGASTAKQSLRTRVLTRLRELGPEWVARESEAALTAKLGRGLDALDKYFSDYIPQLILTAVVTPILVAALFVADPVSAITVVIVFPIIPMFMVLIGLATRGSQDTQWAALKRLSAAYLDVIRGLPTLKLFRREFRQVERIKQLTGEYRRRTMSVLRVTFLSGFVLDLAGTFSVALVAVTVGTRLVSGEFPIAVGLFVLLLVPEVFVPIRQVGAAFHASSEGLAAASDVFEVLETPLATTASAQRRGATTGGSENGAPVLALRDVQVIRNGSPTAKPVSFDVAPGEVVALAGPSGVGKSSVIAAILGLTTCAGDMVRPAELAWAGQRPGLLQGTITDNVALGDANPDPLLVREAMHQAALAHLPADLPLGPAGRGLSGGQAQRVAIARALYRLKRRGAPLLVLDEPTSALDRDTEAEIVRQLRAVARDRAAVLVVSHRPALLDGADRVVTLEEVEVAV